MEKVTKEGTVEEALHSLQSKMPSFLEHVFIKRKQAEFFEKCTGQMQPDEAVVVVVQHQDEIQAAHWSQPQVTLFTVAIWTKDSDDNTKCSSHVIMKSTNGPTFQFKNKYMAGILMDLPPNLKTCTWLASTTLFRERD